MRLFALARLIVTATAVVSFARTIVNADPVVADAPATLPAGRVIDLSGRHDFAAPREIEADAATDLPGLCTLEEFRAMQQADRYIYSFEEWPAESDNLGVNAYDFYFHLADAGVTDQKLRLTVRGAFPATGILTRMKAGDGAASPRYLLAGLGNIGWGSEQTHTFNFERPVSAFGLVYRSAEDFTLSDFHWAAASDNGYPVTYTLTDGTIVNIGEKGVPSAAIARAKNTFVGVIDKTGLGIVSINFHLKGIGKGDQSITADDMAFVAIPRPAVSEIINLRSSHEFAHPDLITNVRNRASEAIASLADFRFIVGTHRFVYDFSSWPPQSPDSGSNKCEFQFDVKGKGDVGEKISVTATSAGGTAKLSQKLLTDQGGAKTTVLDGLGNIGTAAGAWAEQTFKFEKPVWSFGAVYRSPGDVSLTNGAKVPAASYTLADGTVVDVGADAATGAGAASLGVIPGHSRTFLGVMDTSGKGITSVTFHLQGTIDNQPLYIESLAFALPGLPPGQWKLTWSDEFDGNTLDLKKWNTGYRFVDVINNELQAYVPENVVVSDGLCTIKVEKRDAQNTDQYGKKQQLQKFASGAITTFDKFAQKYGYFEARVKMSSGAGTWPAFWLLPDRGRTYQDVEQRVGNGTPGGLDFGSEIDIFEFMPWWKQSDGLFLSHCGTIWSYGKVTPEDPAPHAYGSYALENNGNGPEELKFPKADTEFHTYGLYLSPDRMTFYIDSKPIYTVTDRKHIAAAPEYILFNCAISGNGWGRGPEKKDPTMAQIEGGMPSAMVIDYVRVYSGTQEP